MPDAADLALEGLQEIALPAPVSYVPATVGWLGVALLLIALLAYAGWRRHQWRVANRYRRAARTELADLQRRLGPPAERGRALAAVPALVKRTVLAFAPRDQVAGLTNSEWLAFLDRTFTPGGFVDGPGRLLSRIAYAPSPEIAAVSETEVADLMRLIGRWIDGHHARV